MLEVNNLKEVEELVLTSNEEDLENNELGLIQENCPHEIGIVLKSQFISDYDVSVYKCLNCSKSFNGEEVKKLNIFKTKINFPYNIGKSYKEKYLMTLKIFYLERKINQSKTDEKLADEITDFYEKNYKLTKNN